MSPSEFCYYILISIAIVIAVGCSPSQEQPTNKSRPNDRVESSAIDQLAGVLYPKAVIRFRVGNGSSQEVTEGLHFVNSKRESGRLTGVDVNRDEFVLSRDYLGSGGDNGDGVLTLEEAKSFKEKAAASDKKVGRGDGIRSSYIYKTVEKHKLELYVDKPRGHNKNAKVPAILFFHGGGFKTGSVNQFRTHSKYLADRGMMGIRVRYRLTREKGVEVTDCIEDAISAIRWVRANAGKLGIDPDRIAAGGGSAGGYLSAATLMIDHINAATDPAGVSAKPNAMVLFNPGFGNREKDGADPRDPDGKGNLLNYVKPGQPPAIIFHGKADKTVPFASVEEFTAAMKRAGNRCELIGYEGVGHSFFNQDKYYELTIIEVDKFLSGLGWLPKQEKVP